MAGTIGVRQKGEHNMEWNQIYGPDSQPDMCQITNYIQTPLWKELCGHLEEMCIRDRFQCFSGDDIGGCAAPDGEDRPLYHCSNRGRRAERKTFGHCYK